jgi:oligopeptide transport system substrate-binding protein
VELDCYDAPAMVSGQPSARTGRVRRSQAAGIGAAGAALVLLLAAGRSLAGSARLPRADMVFVSGGEVSSLDPHTATGVPEGRILRALYEGLVARDPATLEPIPAAAAAWEVSEDGLEYVFHLQPQGRWSNGDPLTAEDFEWSLRRVLEPDTAASYASELDCVVGARAYRCGLDAEGQRIERDWSSVGIEALDAHTLRIRLVRRVPYFLHLLAFQAFFPVHRASLEALREQFPDTWRTRWTRPEHLVVNGPFTLALRRVNDRARMVKNPLYWDAERVAFDTLDALFLEQSGTALNLYLAGEVDWLDGNVPPLLVGRLVGREDFRRDRYLGVYFLRVNVTRPPLDDARVRRALALTVPRKQICTLLLKAGQQPATTLIPWGGIGDYRSPRVLGEAPLEAQRLLREAGYGPETPFPPIELSYNTSESHRDIAEVIASNWRRYLRIDVRLRNQEWKVHVDAQVALAYDVSRSSWIADHPDPIGFLSIFASGHENNRTGWSDAEYDRLLERAAVAEPQQRVDLLAQAEERLLWECPLIPIYSYVSQNLVNPRLGGFGSNLLNEHDPKHWFWKDDRLLAIERRARGMGARAVPAPGPRAGKFSPEQQRAIEARDAEETGGERP